MKDKANQSISAIPKIMIWHCGGCLIKQAASHTLAVKHPPQQLDTTKYATESGN